MKWFRNLNLNTKLLTLLLVVVIGAVVGSIYVVVQNFNSLATRNGQQRAREEAVFMQERIDEISVNMLFTAVQVGNNPVLTTAVEEEDLQTLNFVTLSASIVAGADEIAIYDADEQLITELREHTAISEERDRLVSLALLETDVMDIVAETPHDSEETHEEGDSHEADEISLELAVAVSLSDAEREPIGVLLLGRTLNDEFLQTANLNRNATQIALIHDQQAIAATPREGMEGDEKRDILTVAGILNEDAISQALAGEVVVSDRITRTDSGTPYMVAHMPLEIDGEISAVLLVAVDMSEFIQIRDAQVRSLAATLIIAATVAIVVLTLGLQFSIIRPLHRMQTAVRGVMDGDYSNRLQVASNDEIGTLGTAFNEMSGQVEKLLGDLAGQVEEAEAARSRAERSDEVKSAFLASMSHELRTPLNAIINFTKFVSKGDLGPVNVNQAETLNEVIDSGQHLLSLINDVLDMSKIESGSLRLLIADDVDLNGVLESVVASGKSLLANKSSVELKTEFAPNMPLIRADRQRVLQVLLNIVANACNYTEKGAVTIRAHQSNGEVVIAVQDTGPGIALEDQPAMFESFKQTQSGLRKGSGTGLGMPIAKNLVEVHGGRLWLDSVVGEGSTFYVAIPIKSEHLTPTLVPLGERA